MRPHGQEAVDSEFMGLSIQELRGLPTAFFEDRIYEGDDAIRPSFFIPDHFVETEPVPISLPEKTERVSQKTELPIDAIENDIMAAFDRSQYIALVGETGSGKSTRLPQIALKYGFAEVLQTQPRRPAVRNVASRIEHDLGQDYGIVEASKLVRYQTAVDAKGPESAPIKIITDGLLLVRDLERVAHEKDKRVCIILDEVHEGNSNVDIAAALALRAAEMNPNITVVFSSATMDVENTLDYIEDVTGKQPVHIEVEGRTHHIDWKEAPESTVTEETIKAATNIIKDQEKNPDDPNGILVFLPGKREINDIMDELRKRLPANVLKQATILPLHSKLTPREQEDAFKHYPGIKIILATDIAQTSLTIPDIKYVVDSGMQRRVELDQYGVQGLVLHAISQADCDQRAGRTGRVSDGFYILTRLGNGTPFVPYVARDKYPTAEILRTDIVRHVLRVAGVGINMLHLKLRNTVDVSVIRRAQHKLRELGAFDDNDDITALGKRMNHFPVNVLSARMLVESAQFDEQVRSFMSAVVAAREVGGLQLFAPDVEKRWKALSEERTSDALTQLDLFTAIQGMDERQMKDFDLDIHNVERARELYRKISRQLGAFQETIPPSKTEEREAIRYCVTAGQLTSLYKHLGSGIYELVGRPDFIRTVSNRSTVAGRSPIVTGTPYRVEFDTAEGRQEKHILEHVTFVSPEHLGKLAVDQVTWLDEGFVIRRGRFMQRKRQTLAGIVLGAPAEVPADPSPQLRAAIIEHVTLHPSNTLKELRAIKRELEKLNRRAKDSVPQLTNNALRMLIEEATPLDVTNPALVDNNLRAIMAKRGLTLDDIISPEQRAEIMQQSPDDYTVGDVTLSITYDKKVPTVYHYSRAEIMQIKEEVFLPDGRQIMFMHYSEVKRTKKACTLIELQERLQTEIRLS